MPLPVVFSISGLTITEEEARFFEDFPPLGYILFRRNIADPVQLKLLTASLRQITPDCCILVDQEGGRVQRLSPPHWPKYPCMNDCRQPEDVVQTIAQLSQDLVEAGIDTNCAPVLDVLQPDTDQSIGDRAFSDDPAAVARLGGVACDTFLQNNIRPIIKHLPGHGRAIVDSHEEVPFVTACLETLRRSDFMPFQTVLKQPYGAELWGMVGHCVYNAIDEEFPASLSETVIQDTIRGEIGFENLLFSDDLSMGALKKYGDIATRATLCLAAGCNVALYCSGQLDDMTAIAQAIS